MKKKTHEEFVLELLKKKPNIEVIGEYVNSRTKIKVKCKKCSYVWETLANVLSSTSSGCPNCAGTKKKNTSEFIVELFKINKEIEVLGEYVNSKEPIKCRCKVDNHIWYPIPNTLLMGEGCPKCSRLRSAENLTKTNDEFISDLLKVNPKIVPLEEYQKSNKKILVKCKVCNYEWYSSPNHLLAKEGCPKCAGNLPYTNEKFLYLASNKNKHITVIGKYKNSKNTIECKCNYCSKSFMMLPESILNGVKCPRCRDSKIRTHQDFISDLKEINNNIKIIGHFTNTITKISVQCKVCGHTWDALPQALLRGNGCRNCYLLNNKKENHPKWNKNITTEERLVKRNYFEYTEWIKKVYKRDNWTCQLTGEYGNNNLVAHHLDGYNWCKDKRTDLKNGITLLSSIHKEFHSMYGYGNNTIDQFIEFVKLKYSKREITEGNYNNIINLLHENMEENINEQRDVG